MLAAEDEVAKVPLNMNIPQIIFNILITNSNSKQLKSLQTIT
jgi:hypothetical protein